MAFRFKGDTKRYNLPVVNSYASELKLPLATLEQLHSFDAMLIKVPMPNRSLIVMYGMPRYQFEHSVLRTDINTCLICITFREFSLFIKKLKSPENSSLDLDLPLDLMDELGYVPMEEEMKIFTMRSIRIKSLTCHNNQIVS